MNPLISVIVPCYNVEDFLPETIKSITNQTYSNWELILVDDGSKDNTPLICDEYSKKDSRIKVIHKPNGGLVSARNAGYKVISGEWHMYLDGDDWIDTNTLEKLMIYVNKYQNIDIVFWKCIQELNNIPIKGKWEWGCTEQEHLYCDEECKELARHTLVYKSGIATAWCKLIRSIYAKSYGIMHDDRLRQGAEGIEFSLRAFYHAEKALFVNEYFNHYRFNADSISKQINEKNTLYISDCFNIIEEDIDSFDNKVDFQQSLYQRVVYALIAIAMSTYFHPCNKEKLKIKIKKFKRIISENRLYNISIKKTPIEGMDKLRKITLFFIRYKMYFMLHFIASLKQYYLRIGKFNY